MCAQLTRHQQLSLTNRSTHSTTLVTMLMFCVLSFVHLVWQLWCLCSHLVRHQQLRLSQLSQQGHRRSVRSGSKGSTQGAEQGSKQLLVSLQGRGGEQAAGSTTLAHRQYIL